MGLKEIKKRKHWCVYVDDENTIPTGFEIRRLKTDEQLYGILKAGTRFLVGFRKRRIDAYRRALKLYNERRLNEKDNTDADVVNESNDGTSGMDSK